MKSLKVELKIIKRVTALKNKLHDVPRAIIRAKIAKVEICLKREIKKVLRVLCRI